MPKIISKKKLTRYPITIFKYVKSQYYWYRFWVNKSYKNNRGIEEKSTLEIEFRRAEKKAIKSCFVEISILVVTLHHAE